MVQSSSEADSHSVEKFPDDRGSTDLWNVSELLPDYTAQQPKFPVIYAVQRFISLFSSVRHHFLLRVGWILTLSPYFRKIGF